MCDSIIALEAIRRFGLNVKSRIKTKDVGVQKWWGRPRMMFTHGMFIFMTSIERSNLPGHVCKESAGYAALNFP